MNRYKILLCLTLFWLPTECDSALFMRTITPENVIENRAGVTASVKRTSLSRRIERFAVKHGADPAIAPELAELLSACQHPRVLAAIAAKESNFDLTARGAAGEVGAYQIIPRLHGHPGKTWGSQTRAAERILRDLMSESSGKLEAGVRKYNGKGKAARKYAQHVLAMAYSI